MKTMATETTKTTKGLLGTKLGMTQVWDSNNKLIPVTVIEISPNVVTQVRTPEVDGYSAVQIAYGQIDPRKSDVVVSAIGSTIGRLAKSANRRFVRAFFAARLCEVSWIV